MSKELLFEIFKEAYALGTTRVNLSEDNLRQSFEKLFLKSTAPHVGATSHLTSLWIVSETDTDGTP